MSDENNPNNTKERLLDAKWVLERHLAWIAASEIKVSVIVTIDTALLGGLAAVFSSSESIARTAWAYHFILAASGSVVLGLLCSAMAVLPRTNGPKNSLLFFGTIAARDVGSYREEFKDATDEQLLADCTEQIHRNAQIARDKYVWVRRSMVLSFFAVVPWVAAVGLLVKF